MLTGLKQLLIVPFLATAFLIQAANYYVATTGSDANVGTTTTKPFKTVQKALGKAIAGDFIYVMAGTYKERLQWINSGTATAPITLTNYNGAIVYIDGSAGGTNTTQNEMLLVANKSNITISNIQIQNNYRAGAVGVYIRGSGANIKVLNCKVYNIGWTTNAATIPTSGNNANPFLVVGSAATSISNLTISGNQIYNCITGYSEGLTLNGNVDNFTVSNNSVYNITNIGIDIAGHYSWTGAPANVNFARNGKVQDNIVYNCVSKAAVSAGIYVDGAQSIILERNKSYSNGVGFSIGCENAGFTVTGIVMRENIIYNNQSVGLYFGSNQATSSVSTSSVTNNTFNRNAVLDQWGAEIALQNSANCTIAQNIIVPNNDQAVGIGRWGYTATNLTTKYNLFWRITGNIANILASVTATNSVYGNPKFANATSDFHILTGSKAINAGESTFVAAAGETDMDKQVRIQSGRIDIGADETALASVMPIGNSASELNVPTKNNSDLAAFPNPTLGLVRLNLPEKASVIVVADALGRYIKTVSVQDNTSPLLNISDLPDGIYFFKIVWETKEVTSLKILKKAE